MSNIILTQEGNVIRARYEGAANSVFGCNETEALSRLKSTPWCRTDKGHRPHKNEGGPDQPEENTRSRHTKSRNTTLEQQQKEMKRRNQGTQR